MLEFKFRYWFIIGFTVDSSQSIWWGEEISVKRAVGWKVIQSGLHAIWLGTQFIIQKLLNLSMFTDWYLHVYSLTICCNSVFWSFFTLQTCIYQVLWVFFSFYLFFPNCITLHCQCNKSHLQYDAILQTIFFFRTTCMNITCNHIYCNDNSICSVIFLIYDI